MSCPSPPDWSKEKSICMSSSSSDIVAPEPSPRLTPAKMKQRKLSLQTQLLILLCIGKEMTQLNAFLYFSLIFHSILLCITTCTQSIYLLFNFPIIKLYKNNSYTNWLVSWAYKQQFFFFLGSKVGRGRGIYPHTDAILLYNFVLQINLTLTVKYLWYSEGTVTSIFKIFEPWEEKNKTLILITYKTKGKWPLIC